MNSKHSYAANSIKIDLERELLRPHTHLKDLRSHEVFADELVNMFQYWLKIPEDKLTLIKNFMSLFVPFTLLLDDIQDHSVYRRIMPTAHCVYGVPLTVNSILHSFGLCIEKIRDLYYPEAMNIFISQYLEMIRGKGEDVFRRVNQICPNEEDYNRMAKGKSSQVILMLVRIMQLFSENKIDYSKFIMDYGVYYVIRNDYCSLMNQQGLDGKSRKKDFKNINDITFCEDMTKGKFSFPVVHAIQFPEGRPLLYMMRLQSRDRVLKLQYRSLLESLGSVEYTRATLDKYDSELRKELSRLGGNPEIECVLDDFKNWHEEKVWVQLCRLGGNPVIERLLDDFKNWHEE